MSNVLHSSESAEWYTPAIYLQAVRAVLGTIDLDPACCNIANRIVQAMHFYTKEQNGLMRSWSGRIFCNPPYGKTNTGKSNQKIWSEKVIAEYESGNIEEAILLINAATGDEWYHQLRPYWLCETRRIHFYTASGMPTQPTHGNAFVYFGTKSERFRDVFHSFGRIVPPDTYYTPKPINLEMWREKQAAMGIVPHDEARGNHA